MQYRRVGDSGMIVSELSFGTGTFGGVGDFYRAWGETDVSEARAIIDLALEGGITLFDTADVYSNGAAEEILGAALRGRRDDVLISTKAGMAVGDGPGEWGSSRSRLLSAVEGSLRRLQTDHIDLFQLHAYDASTPMEEVLQTLELLVQQGKVRYTGVSNFAGWQLMKSLALADEHHRPRYIAHQVYYSLVGRDYEWELMPLALEEGVGAIVWSPLGWGRLTGKIRRREPLPERSRSRRRCRRAHRRPCRTFRRRPRPTVSSVIIGARDETQLRDNLGAVGWRLDPEQRVRLDAVSTREAPYPYFAYIRHEVFARLNPPVAV